VARTKAGAARYREANREKLRLYHRAWYAKNRGRLNAKVAAWRRDNPGTKSEEHRADRYCLSREQYLQMVKDQGGRCALCERVPAGKGNMATLRVDHDHGTGDVRALLCHKCNAGLGMFSDDPVLLFRAAEYLANHGRFRECA